MILELLDERFAQRRRRGDRIPRHHRDAGHERPDGSGSVAFNQDEVIRTVHRLDEQRIALLQVFLREREPSQERFLILRDDLWLPTKLPRQRTLHLLKRMTEEVPDLEWISNNGLIAAAIDVVIISGRQSAAVERRMAELGVKYLIQGCKDKVEAFDSVVSTLAINLADTIYVGDDIPDLELLRHAGFSVAVRNAVEAVKKECDAITDAEGGYGAVREVCDRVLGAVSQAEG